MSLDEDFSKLRDRAQSAKGKVSKVGFYGLWVIRHIDALGRFNAAELELPTESSFFLGVKNIPHYLLRLLARRPQPKWAVHTSILNTSSMT